MSVQTFKVEETGSFCSMSLVLNFYDSLRFQSRLLHNKFAMVTGFVMVREMGTDNRIYIFYNLNLHYGFRQDSSVAHLHVKK